MRLNNLDKNIESEQMNDNRSESSEVEEFYEMIEPCNINEEESISDVEHDIENTHDDLIDETTNEDNQCHNYINETDMNFLGDMPDDIDMENENDENELFCQFIPTTNDFSIINYLFPKYNLSKPNNDK